MEYALHTNDRGDEKRQPLSPSSEVILFGNYCCLIFYRTAIIWEVLEKELSLRITLQDRILL